MSFGYGVGDVIAVLGLVKRAADEIRHYRDAPRHFQQLQGELDIYHTTIQSILAIEPASLESFAIVQRMRCIALFSRLPLQRFIDILHAKEGVLGHHGTARSLSSIGTRLHWSMVDRKDVGALRDTLFSGLLAINVLQGRLLEYKLGPEFVRLAAAESRHLAVFAHELELLRDTAEKAPKAITDLKSAIEQRDLSNASRLDSIRQDMSVVQSNITTIETTFDAAAVFGRDLGNKLLTTLGRILTVVTQLLKIIKVLAKTSQKVLRNVSEGVSILLDIRKEMKRLARSIDTMPIHIGLELIRFDDMFGESWALPFQACTEWQSVEVMINTVIFANKRPGHAAILTGEFYLTTADDNTIIFKTAWNHYITPGMHIKQYLSEKGLLAMVDSCTLQEWTAVAVAKPDPPEGCVW
ncbi:hypothetical protein SEUCBS140593_001648 [Sporothrix eucalyptigena]|uniref:Ubiquitin-like domain-containing protein n=1 Tax=Sporothrix eucalyptigena TaxID=1812306 RepID=A0ABP0B007_9PEZI